MSEPREEREEKPKPRIPPMVSAYIAITITLIAVALIPFCCVNGGFLLLYFREANKPTDTPVIKKTTDDPKPPSAPGGLRKMKRLDPPQDNPGYGRSGNPQPWPSAKDSSK